MDRPPCCLPFCLTLSVAVCLLKSLWTGWSTNCVLTFSLVRCMRKVHVKRNGSAHLRTAEMKVSRPNKVPAERLLKTKLRFFFVTGRCGQADCKYAHGHRELKHAPNLKKITKLCFEFLEGCSLMVPRVPLVMAMKICAPQQAFTRLSHAISLNGVLATPSSEPRVHRCPLMANLLRLPGGLGRASDSHLAGCRRGSILASTARPRTRTVLSQ